MKKREEGSDCSQELKLFIGEGKDVQRKKEKDEKDALCRSRS